MCTYCAYLCVCVCPVLERLSVSKCVQLGSGSMNDAAGEGGCRTVSVWFCGQITGNILGGEIILMDLMKQKARRPAVYCRIIALLCLWLSY